MNSCTLLWRMFDLRYYCYAEFTATKIITFYHLQGLFNVMKIYFEAFESCIDDGNYAFNAFIYFFVKKKPPLSVIFSNII